MPYRSPSGAREGPGPPLPRTWPRDPHPAAPSDRTGPPAGPRRLAGL